MGYTGFVDVIAANSGKVPAVKALGIIALYATGSSLIEETAAERARFKNAGVGVVLIDQTPSQAVLASGLADVGDIESLAGTYTAAAAACKARAAHGWQTTLYVGYDNLAALKSTLQSSGVDMSLVQYGVADYNWSIAEAEVNLAAEPTWAYCQYGDNITNAATKIPGTDVTCGEAGCDIDVAKSTWAEQFMSDPAPVKAFPAPSGMSETSYAMANFGWSAVPKAESYHFQIVTEDGKVVVDKSVSTTTVHSVALPPGTMYNWRVAVHATDSIGSSPWTAFHTFTT
jgi:hypothetical protein